eukprot:Nk52_evm11s78 gene=Nk52_evmTU11s78
MEIEAWPQQQRSFRLSLTAGENTLKAVVYRKLKEMELDPEEDPMTLFNTNHLYRSCSEDNDTSDDEASASRKSSSSSVSSVTSVGIKKSLVREFVGLMNECTFIDISAYKHIGEKMERELLSDPTYVEKKKRMEFLAMYFFCLYQSKEVMGHKLSENDFQLKSAVDDVLYRMMGCYM